MEIRDCILGFCTADTTTNPNASITMDGNSGTGNSGDIFEDSYSGFLSGYGFSHIAESLNSDRL
jgi:hypothetical protein